MAKEFERKQKTAFYCTLDDRKREIKETARLIEDDEGRLIWVLKRKEDKDEMKDMFGAAMIAMFKDVPDNTDRMYWMVEGRKTVTLLHDYEADRRRVEEEERLKREEEERKERELREQERARRLGGEKMAEKARQEQMKEREKEARKGKKGKKRDKVISLLAPNSMAFMHGNLTRVQNIVLHKVIKSLQPYISDSIKSHNQGEDKKVMPEEGYTEISVPLSEFSAKSEYAVVEREVKDLMNTLIEFDVTGEDGKVKRFLNIFELVDVPLVGGSKMVKCRTTKGITELLCNPFLPMAEYTSPIARGFFAYQSNVIEMVSSKNTQRIYLWLSSFKRSEEKKLTFSIEKIRELLSLGGKYEDWYSFRKRILEEPKRELDENAYRFDLSFTYAPIYNSKRTIGFPDAVEFSIVSNEDKAEYMYFRQSIDSIIDRLQGVGVSVWQTESITKLIDRDNIAYAEDMLSRILEQAARVEKPAAFVYKRLLQVMELKVKETRRERKAQEK